jgi:hypothetical protein
LEVTQQAAFDQACREIDADEVAGHLRLLKDDLSKDPIPSKPDALAIRPSRVGWEVHRCVEHVVGLVGDEGGLLPEPLALDVDLMLTRHQLLGRWGRPRAEGGWLTELCLVEDAKWTFSLLVLRTIGSFSRSGWALGGLSDERARAGHRLRQLVQPLFEQPRQPRMLAGEAPSFVQHFGCPLLKVKDLRELLMLAFDQLDAVELARDVDVLTGVSGSRSRLEWESQGEMSQPPEPKLTIKTVFDRWWDFASAPDVTADEYSTWLAINKVPQ